MPRYRVTTQFVVEADGPDDVERAAREHLAMTQVRYADVIARETYYPVRGGAGDFAVLPTPAGRRFVETLIRSLTTDAPADDPPRLAPIDLDLLVARLRAGQGGEQDALPRELPKIDRVHVAYGIQFGWSGGPAQPPGGFDPLVYLLAYALGRALRRGATTAADGEPTPATGTETLRTLVRERLGTLLEDALSGDDTLVADLREEAAPGAEREAVDDELREIARLLRAAPGGRDYERGRGDGYRAAVRELEEILPRELAPIREQLSKLAAAPAVAGPSDLREDVTPPDEPRRLFGIGCRSVGPCGTSVDFFARSGEVVAVWENASCPYVGGDDELEDWSPHNNQVARDGHNISVLTASDLADLYTFLRDRLGRAS